MLDDSGNCGAKKKEGPGEIVAEALYESCGRSDGDPSAVIETATSGYHYTLNHLLPLKPPRRPADTSVIRLRASAPSCHDSTTHTLIIPDKYTQIK